MAHSVECLLEVDKVVVKVALVLYAFCKHVSAVEFLFNCTPSCSEACATLLGWLIKLMVLQSWHCLTFPFFGKGITGNLLHSVGHFFCSRIFWHIAFTVPSIPLLISSDGMSSDPGYLSVFPATSTSPSVPADCPHFQWRPGKWSFGGFVVWSRRCRVHSCTCHRSILPTSSALHGCLWSAYCLCHRWQLPSASWFWWDHVVRLCCFLLSILSPLNQTAPIQYIISLVDVIFFLTSLCNVGTVHCFVIWVSQPVQ